MTDKQLLEQALEALEDTVNGCICRNCIKQVEAIGAVRARLEQPEQEPAACVACEGNPKGENIPCAVCGVTPPEAPVQESDDLTIAYMVGYEKGKAAVQRQWVGLSDEELQKALGFGEFTTESTKATLTVLARAIEAKLKEKNG